MRFGAVGVRFPGEWLVFRCPGAGIGEIGRCRRAGWIVWRTGGKRVAVDGVAALYDMDRSQREPLTQYFGDRL
jgi:hypothetical protein